MSDGVILAAENLTKEFKGFFAVEGVNLKVRRGQIPALIEPNGTSKTTTLKGGHGNIGQAQELRRP